MVLIKYVQLQEAIISVILRQKVHMNMGSQIHRLEDIWC